MKIVSRLQDVYDVDIDGNPEYSYMIYLMDDNNNPLEAKVADGNFERDQIISEWIVRYGYMTYEHYDTYHLDLTNEGTVDDEDNDDKHFWIG